MKLSKLQEEILNKKDKKIVVLASAASGKTALMTEKTRQILQKGVDPKTIAVITFTNMAAEELRKRLGEDYREGIFIGTIHSLANYFLLSNGIDTKKYLKQENFDKLFSLVKQHPNCVRPISYLLLDEAQDSDDLEFEFILNMINPEHFFICGDLKQSIYQWKGARPDMLQKLTQDDRVATYSLNQNYRNGYNILQYAKRIIYPTGLIDDSESMTNNSGHVVEREFSSSAIINYIKQIDEYKNWAILTRTNADIELISKILFNAGIPYDTFKQGDLTKDELNKKMEQNTVKILTIHSAKGLEWDNVFVIGTRFYPAEERNVNYVAATRARKNLIWIKNPKKNKKTKIANWE